VELEIPEDQLHMVVRGVPKMSPSDVMQIIKSISAREFFRNYSAHQKELFLLRNKRGAVKRISKRTNHVF
jgi:putative transposase